jgi:hypothetical protein
MRSPVWCKSIQLTVASGLGPSHLHQIPVPSEFLVSSEFHPTFAVSAISLHILPVEAYDSDMKQKAVMA